MIDPMLAAHIQQMRTMARHRNDTDFGAHNIPRRRLFALGGAALAMVAVGLFAGSRPTQRPANLRSSPSH